MKTSEPEHLHKLNKSQLAQAVSNSTGLTQSQSHQAIGALINIIVTSLQQGQTIGLTGLGTLSIKETAPRTGINPLTKKKIQIPARKKILFTVSKNLKNQL